MSGAASSAEREVVARSRRIDAAALAGIEAQIEACHRISHVRRIAGVAPFLLMYGGGAWLAGSGWGGGFSVVMGVLVMGVAMNTLGILIYLEHHLFPQVPSYHLQRAHQLVWDRLPRALYAPSYRVFLGGFFRSLFRLSLAPFGVDRPSRTL